MIQYLSGKVTGDMALETIGLGDLIVPNQVIGIANIVEIPLLDVNNIFILNRKLFGMVSSDSPILIKTCKKST
jgi:hypothetical protein